MQDIQCHLVMKLYFRSNICVYINTLCVCVCVCVCVLFFKTAANISHHERQLLNMCDRREPLHANQDRFDSALSGKGNSPLIFQHEEVNESQRSDHYIFTRRRQKLHKQLQHLVPVETNRISLTSRSRIYPRSLHSVRPARLLTTLHFLANLLCFSPYGLSRFTPRVVFFLSSSLLHQSGDEEHSSELLHPV